MKLRFQKQGSQAWTVTDMLVLIVVLIILGVVMLLPVLASAHVRAAQLNCARNLKQVQLSFQIWAGDNNNKFPMSVSVTNGGAKELIDTNNVAGLFLVMSNELSTPLTLICPADTKVTYRPYALDFAPDFCNKNISYFVGVDADKNYPQRLLCGDDNFQIGGADVPPGVLSLSTNTPIAWSPGRHDNPSHIPFLKVHHFVGNIGYADGSVAEVSTLGLQESLVQTDIATNRLAIP